MSSDSIVVAEALLERSNALHERVQRFALNATDSDRSFEALALDIAQFQADANPSYRRLVQASGDTLARLDDIPAVPVEAFRVTRVAAHPRALDEVTFLTSGTTSGARGGHHLRRTDTYRKVALQWGRRALVSQEAHPMRVVCLAPRPTEPQSSSLGFMMQAFLEEFGEPCEAKREGAWLLDERGVNVDGLRREAAAANATGRPLLILATSFALVYLLEALHGDQILSSPGTVIMQTGGFKGKSRELDATTMRQDLARAFGISPLSIVSEYGMTELCSQLYEATLGNGLVSNEPGWLIAPPWMRVEARHPITQAKVTEGIEGLACFTDLANVDSAVRILTMDRVICKGQKLQLLGRYEGAVPRGCSLAVEEMLG